MKTLASILLCILCAATLNAQTWNCGDPNVNGGADVTATLNGGTLTISGTSAFRFFCQKKLFFTDYLVFLPKIYKNGFNTF